MSIPKTKDETFSERRYALRHKPTKKWVSFKNDDLELTATHITLVNLHHSTISGTKDLLEAFLKRSFFKGTPNYGNENFLEFEVVKLKAIYTIDMDE